MCEEDKFLCEVMNDVQEEIDGQAANPTEYEELDTPSFLSISMMLK